MGFGLNKLVEHLISKLDHHDAAVRQDAAIAIGELGEHANRAVPLLLDRLRSPLTATHDRMCAAWALPRECRGNEKRNEATRNDDQRDLNKWATSDLSVRFSSKVPVYLSPLKLARNPS
jgi:HEAT repeat protein